MSQINHNFIDYNNPFINNLFIFSIITYLPLIFLLKKFIDSLSQKNKDTLCSLFKIPWALWCFGLSIFSMFGTYHTFKFIYNNNYEVDIFNHEVGYWYHAFLISKIPELIDTFFIIIRSKPLVILQWYHHFATLIISYYVTRVQCDRGIPFMFMNYFVHVFMYNYFALYNFFPKQLKLFGTFVNILQTLQMLFAIILAIYEFNLKRLKCVFMPESFEYHLAFVCGISMYGSYFILFAILYFERLDRIAKKKATFDIEKNE
jgi:elongation of very long chain fatty acids protein 6